MTDPQNEKKDNQPVTYSLDENKEARSGDKLASVSEAPKSIPAGNQSRLLFKTFFNLVTITAGLTFLIIILLVVYRLRLNKPIISTQDDVISLSKLRPAYKVIAFTVDKLYIFEDQDKRISEFNPSDSRKSKIVVGDIPSIEKTAISPDAQKIAILSTREGFQSDIYVLNLSVPAKITLASSNLDKFSQKHKLQIRSNFAWSPDGQHIAFVAYDENQSDIFIASTVSSVTRRLTYTGKNISSLIWTNLETISFVSDWEGQDRVYLIDSDGGNLRHAW